MFKTLRFILPCIFCILSFIFLLCVYSQDEYTDPAITRLVNEGVKLHKNKDYIGALKAFEEALSLEPENILVRQNISIAHNNYGKYLVDRTDYDNAISQFRMALYFDPSNKTADANLDSVLSERGIKAGDPQVRTQLGDKLREDAKFELALVEYQKAFALSKVPDQNILINIGDIYYILYLRDGQKRTNINLAIEYYKKALNIKETAKAHIKFGDGLFAIKDINNAIEHYKQALQLEPDSQDAISANVRGWNEAVRLAPLVAENHIGLATALQYKKDFASSEEEYNQALKLSPNNEIAKKGLELLAMDKLKAQTSQYLQSALTLQAQKKYSEAIGEYIKALQINPKDPKLHYNIGTAFQASEDFEHAEKAYKKTLELDPNNQKAKSALDILAKQVTTKKIKELTNRAIELQNSSNYQEAITTYLAAISLQSNDPSLYYNLGTAYQAAEDLNNAKIQYEKALEFDKNNPTYLNTLKLLKVDIASPLVQSAINKQSQNDYTGAINDYLMALEYIPDDAQAYFNLSTAYQANKQTDEAIQSYLKSYQLDAASQVDALFFIATLYEEKANNKSAIEYYQKYIQIAPNGTYLKDAKERMEYLKTL